MSTLKRPLRILVLDDDTKILRLLGIFLKQQGYTVVTANNGREGLRRMLDSAFDLLIVDVQMPEMDGIAFAREVRAIWPWENMIFCTGYYNPDVRKAGDELGIRHILQKPLSFNTLEEAIQDVTRGPTPEGDISCELGYLADFTEECLEHMQVGRALASFPATLAKTIPCSAAGIFSVRGQAASFALESAAPVDPGFLTRLRDDMAAHYETLADATLSARPEPRVSLTKDSRGLIASSTHFHVMVPVSGPRTLYGILCVILPGDGQSPPVELSHTLITAHHLSTILESMERARSQSIRDPLTGLLTRHYLHETVERTWLLEGDAVSGLGVISVDMDDFERINETHGYPTGDRILKEVADILRKEGGPRQLGVRMAQDGFTLLIPGSEPGKLEQTAHAILDGIHNISLPTLSEPLRPTATLGVAIHSPQGEERTSGHLIECAEQALYTGKREGGDRVKTWAGLTREGGATYNLHPILVVDDDPQIVQLISRMLNKSMFEVTGAGTVAEAVSIMEQGKKFELILTDLVLPRQDGTVMMKLAREMDPDVALVVVSGKISKQSEGRLREAGAMDILRKPFSAEDLRATVKEAIAAWTRRVRKG